jgi:hypothetical protein
VYVGVVKMEGEVLEMSGEFLDLKMGPGVAGY